MATNTSRSLKWIRDNGYEAGVVERFLSHAGKFGKRVDLFNFIDIIAMNGEEILGIQSCGQAFTEHHKKMLEQDEILLRLHKWLKSHGRVLLIGWRKLKVKRGGKAVRWTPRVREYYLVGEEIKWRDGHA